MDKTVVVGWRPARIGKYDAALGQKICSISTNNVTIYRVDIREMKGKRSDLSNITNKYPSSTDSLHWYLKLFNDLKVAERRIAMSCGNRDRATTIAVNAGETYRENEEVDGNVLVMIRSRT